MFFNSFRRHGYRLILKDPQNYGNSAKVLSMKHDACGTPSNSPHESQQKSKNHEGNCHQLSAESIPVPDNLVGHATNSTFSPHRHRDIMSNVIPTINSTSSLSSTSLPMFSVGEKLHGANSPVDVTSVESYDCSGPVSLNGVMQSNVPTPFDLLPSKTNDIKCEKQDHLNHYIHLNMPGGQWSQETKFTAQNLQDSHYMMCEKNPQADRSLKDVKRTISSVDRQKPNTKGAVVTVESSRAYSTKSNKAASTSTTKGETYATDSATSIPVSKGEQLKRAFKEYGAVIVVFHVGISLISLGSCYALISSGFDLAAVLQRLGWISSSSSAIAGTSNFVLAYGIHKLFATVRISITLAATPFIVRYLRSKGLLRKKISTAASPSREQTK